MKHQFEAIDRLHQTTEQRKQSELEQQQKALQAVADKLNDIVPIFIAKALCALASQDDAQPIVLFATNYREIRDELKSILTRLGFSYTIENDAEAYSYKTSSTSIQQGEVFYTETVHAKHVFYLKTTNRSHVRINDPALLSMESRIDRLTHFYSSKLGYCAAPISIKECLLFSEVYNQYRQYGSSKCENPNHKYTNCDGADYNIIESIGLYSDVAFEDFERRLSQPKPPAKKVTHSRSSFSFSRLLDTLTAYFFVGGAFVVLAYIVIGTLLGGLL